MHTCIHAYRHASMHTHMHISMLVCLYTHTHTCIHTKERKGINLIEPPLLSDKEAGDLHEYFI